MPLKYWIALYVVHLLFCLWVVGWGGAELLEDTFVGQFLTRVGAPERSPAGIKFLACAAILIGTLVFVVGLLYPEVRSSHPWWLMLGKTNAIHTTPHGSRHARQGGGVRGADRGCCHAASDVRRRRWTPMGMGPTTLLGSGEAGCSFKVWGAMDEREVLQP